jgi:CBS domain-containing protein
MTVASILNQKGRNVVTADRTASLADIVAMLAEKRIGAVLLVEGDEIRGIISERDIVRALSTHGGDALAKRAEDCMTPRVVTCTPEDTINDLMHKMTSGRFRHVPVVDRGKLAGIVSIGDVVKERIQEVEREAEQIREYIATA